MTYGCEVAVSRRSARFSPGRWAGLSLIVFLQAGCQDYQWEMDLSRFGSAEEQARQEAKYMFIFYKSWLDDSSNRMLSGEVLSDPEVASLFQNTINLLVEEAGGPDYVAYMSRFGVKSPPASVIVAPNGRYQVRMKFVPKDRFLEFARKSLELRPSDKKPATRPRPPDR